ncbi:hypothetical protein [Oceanobacillus chungangensis]|nr:hypothetical protein [Oceanobacillus chungangensis]
MKESVSEELLQASDRDYSPCGEEELVCPLEDEMTNKWIEGFFFQKSL